MVVVGKAITSLIGLAVIGFAIFCAVFVIRSDLWTWFATAFGLFSAAMLGFLGLTLVVGPWRRRKEQGAV